MDIDAERHNPTPTIESMDRPGRIRPEPVPPIPPIAPDASESASTIYSRFRTGLSRRRTSLSEHRTDLSEFRTNLSEHRTELGMRRTGMAVHRTRMAADRTLMAEIRTSLSMIGFGFTLYQAFHKLAAAGTFENDAAPRNFGLTLVLLGMLILIGGIWRHVQFARQLRAMRHNLVNEHLLHGQTLYPVSISLIVALGLLGLGLVTVLTIVMDLALLG